MPVNQRSAVFIDGANLYATTKALGFDIDYKKLLKEFQSRDNLLRAFYYTAMIEDQEYSSIRPLIDWLDYNGYRVVTKPAKEFTDSMGRRKYKGNMDIELAIDALELSPHIDHMVLFSGDGDFRSLVEAMQRRGVQGDGDLHHPDPAGDDLRRAAAAGRRVRRPRRASSGRIGREPGERPARPAGDAPSRYRGEGRAEPGPGKPLRHPPAGRRGGVAPSGARSASSQARTCRALRSGGKTG